MASYLYGSDDAFRQKHIADRGFNYGGEAGFGGDAGINLDWGLSGAGGADPGIYAGAFDASDLAGQEYTSSFDFNDPDMSWEGFYKGLGESKTGAWDDFFASPDQATWGAPSRFQDHPNKITGEMESVNMFSDEAWAPHEAVRSELTQAPIWKTAGRTTATPRQTLGASGLDPTNNTAIPDLAKFLEENPTGARTATADDVTEALKLDPNSTLQVGDNMLDFWSGVEGTEAMSLEKLADIAERQNTDVAAAVDEYASGYSAADKKAEGLAAGLTPWQTSMRTASSELQQAQERNQESKYQAVTDLLRGNMARGQRAGEFGTIGAQNRLVLGAQIQAAQERSGLDEQSALEAAEREYTLSGNVANAKRAIDDAKLAQRETLMLEFQKDRQEIIAEFSKATGLVQEQAEKGVKLTEEVVAIKAAQGELDELNAKEERAAMLSVLAKWAENPTEYDKYIVQLTRKVFEAGLKNQQLKDEAMDKLQNMDWLGSLIFQVISYDEFAALSAIDVNSLLETLATYAMGGGWEVTLSDPAIAKKFYGALSQSLAGLSETEKLEERQFITAEDLVKRSTDKLSGWVEGFKGDVSQQIKDNKPGAGQFDVTCWVAREVYGAHNPAWLDFRQWMFSSAPGWFFKLYLTFGRRFANFISNKPRLKARIRMWMDSKIGR